MGPDIWRNTLEPSGGNPSGPLNREHPSLPFSFRKPVPSTLMPAAFDTSSALRADGIATSNIAIAIRWILILINSARQTKRVHVDPLASSRNRSGAVCVIVDYGNADVMVSVHLFENFVDAVEAAGAGDHRLGRDLFRDHHLQHRGIVRRLHPERADQLKFHRDDPIDRHRNFALLSRGGEPDLHMTSLLAATHDRVAAAGRAARTRAAERGS